MPVVTISHYIITRGRRWSLKTPVKSLRYFLCCAEVTSSKQYSLILLLRFLLKGSGLWLKLMSAVITVFPLRWTEIWLATHSQRSVEPCSMSGFVDSAKAFISQGTSTLMSLAQPTWNYDTPDVIYIWGERKKKEHYVKCFGNQR